MKIHNGWLIANEHPDGPRRIRLKDVCEYAYSPAANATFLQTPTSQSIELPGNHVELLDSHFAKETA